MIKLKGTNTRTGATEFKEADFSCEIEGTPFGLIEEREGDGEVWFLVHVPSGCQINPCYWDSRRQAIEIVKHAYKLLTPEMRATIETATDDRLESLRGTSFVDFNDLLVSTANGRETPRMPSLSSLLGGIFGSDDGDDSGDDSGKSEPTPTPAEAVASNS